MKMIDWHKKYTSSVQRKLHLSDYALLWVAFAKGLIVGLLIYHFFLRWCTGDSLTRRTYN